MEYHLTAEAVGSGRSQKASLYLRMSLLVAAALVLCGAIVLYANQSAEGFLTDVSSFIGLAATTLLPYMIAALVAAITAIAVITILPLARSVDRTQHILGRIRDLNAGDLTSKVTVSGDGQLKEIAGELNRAIATLGHEVTSLKLINRQQWVCLCEIRDAIEQQDCATALNHVKEMEKNWEKLAQIEKQLMT